jgi:hypothetical protein
MYADPVESSTPDRKLKYFYFVTGINKINPSVSQVTLKLDTWTTYSTSTEIAGLRLERGHYPHAQTPASKYLANPLENNIGVTAVEPDLPTVKPLVSFEKFVSSQASAPRVVVAMTTDLQDLNSLWLDVLDFVDIGRPSGKALPPDYWWEDTIATTDTDYLGSKGHAPTPAVAPAINTGTVLGAARHYSMSESAFTAFINLCRKKLPQVLKTIQAVYVIDSSLLTESGTTFSFYSITEIKTLTSATGQNLMDTIAFSKDQFNYDPKYDEFAKLYTNQFAVVEVSNLAGQKVEISIEDVSESLEVYNRVSNLFPFMKLEAFINGVGGKENTHYAVKPLGSVSASLFKSQWEDFKFNLEIPTYAIVAEAREVNGPEAQAELWNTMQRSFNEKSIADGNTYLNRETTYDSLTTDLTNNKNSIDNVKTNQLSSIGRSYSNDSESIAKELSNASDTITKDYSNNSELIDAARLISDLTVQREYDVALTSAGNIRLMTQDSLELSKAVSENNNTTLDSNTSSSIFNAYYTRNYELEAQMALFYETRQVSSFDSKLGFYNTYVAARLGILASTSNGIGAIVGGIGSMNAGTILSSALGAVTDIAKAEETAKLNIEVAKIRAMISTNLGSIDVSTTDPIWAANMEGGALRYEGRSLAVIANDYQQDVGYQVAINKKQTEEGILSTTVENNTANINLEFGVNQEIADAVKALSEYVARESWSVGMTNNETRDDTDTGVNDRTKSTNTTIANRNSSVNSGIAVRNNTTDSAITNANYDTDNENLDRSYSTDLENLKKTTDTRLHNADLNIQTAYKSSMKNYLEEVIEAPTVYLENNSKGWTDAWGHRGLDIRIRRCSKGIEKMAGDMFSRYGYHTDGLWIESPILSQMTNFTFWKAEEAWIVASHIDETNKEILRNIFKRGTTIWVNPEELLRIDITANKTRS